MEEECVIIEHVKGSGRKTKITNNLISLLRLKLK